MADQPDQAPARVRDTMTDDLARVIDEAIVSVDDTRPVPEQLRHVARAVLAWFERMSGVTIEDAIEQKRRELN